MTMVASTAYVEPCDEQGCENEPTWYGAYLLPKCDDFSCCGMEVWSCDLHADAVREYYNGAALQCGENIPWFTRMTD